METGYSLKKDQILSIFPKLHKKLTKSAVMSKIDTGKPTILSDQSALSNSFANQRSLPALRNRKTIETYEFPISPEKDFCDKSVGPNSPLPFLPKNHFHYPTKVILAQAVPYNFPKKPSKKPLKRPSHKLFQSLPKPFFLSQNAFKGKLTGTKLHIF